MRLKIRHYISFLAFASMTFTYAVWQTSDLRHASINVKLCA